MNTNISKKFILSLSIIVLLDQISKYIIRKNYSFTKNFGAGFGILQNYTAFLIIISSIILILVLIYYKHIPKKTSYQIFSGLAVGGLIGNLIDRIIFGFVTDFIDVGFWPSFNIADSALSVGIIGLIILIIKDDNK